MRRHPIRNFLVEKKLTQIEFSSQLGITDQYLSMILRGIRWPSFKLAQKIYMLSKIPISTLLRFNRTT